MRSTLLRRGWIAAAALVAVALGASLPAPTFARTPVITASSTSARLVGSAGFDQLVLPRVPVANPTAAPAELTAAPASAVNNAVARGGQVAFRRARAEVAPSAATGTGTWAFIVGINDYVGSQHDLFAAANDAREVERALLQLGAGSDHIRTLIDGQATADAIRGGLDWLTANAGPDAVAVFFYAGHAVKVGPDTEALVGADMGEIRDIELGDRLASLPARQAWIGIAGCYGGGFTEALAPGRILTGAAPANSLAYENSRFARSYVVEYMVHQAMVEGRASESVQAAFAYAADAISREYPERVPVQIDQTTGPLDLRPPPPAPPAPPQASGSNPPPTTTTTAPPGVLPFSRK